jgi:hypothetical protein
VQEYWKRPEIQQDLASPCFDPLCLLIFLPQFTHPTKPQAPKIMKAIARYPFQGDPRLSQLIFPAGAPLRVDTKKSAGQGGWMFGSYLGRSGWFPESYVELQIPPPRLPSSPKVIITRSNSRAEENDLPSFDEGDDINNQTEENFQMMGGTPGDLFENAPKPTTPPTFFLPHDEPEEDPVDIYRHAPARKRTHAMDYTPEISIQITSSAQPVRPTVRYTQVSPTTTTTNSAEFWKLHPGRALPGHSPEQALALERGFEGLKETEKIDIVVTEKKKKRFPRFAKTIKRAAQKTVQAVQKH